MNWLSAGAPYSDGDGGPISLSPKLSPQGSHTQTPKTARNPPGHTPAHPHTCTRTYLLTYLLTYLPAYLLTYLPAYLLLAYLLTHRALEASAWVNLVFGVGDRPVVPKRIRKILEMMGMTATLKLIEEDFGKIFPVEGFRVRGLGFRVWVLGFRV